MCFVCCGCCGRGSHNDVVYFLWIDLDFLLAPNQPRRAVSAHKTQLGWAAFMYLLAHLKQIGFASRERLQQYI